MLRIISIRVRPVAGLFSAIYACIGFASLCLSVLTRRPETVTFPFGIVIPMLNLNLNLTMDSTGGIVYRMSLTIIAIACYAITGWLSGAAIILCLNLFAKKIGGIDAKFVSVVESQHAKDATA